jgi:myo-inositol catabolism protein IolC
MTFQGEQRRREQQQHMLRCVSTALRGLGVPLIVELLVPATGDQLAAVSGRAGRYDRDLRPSLVIRVIADHQAAGIEPAIWKVEGLESADAARAVVAQIRAGGRQANAIVLGHDARAARTDHWLEVAAPIDGFAGFAIGGSIWEQPIARWIRGDTSQDETTSLIARRYLRFARNYCAASDQSRRTDRAEPSPACPADSPARCIPFRQPADERADIAPAHTSKASVTFTLARYAVE